MKLTVRDLFDIPIITYPVNKEKWYSRFLCSLFVISHSVSRDGHILHLPLWLLAPILHAAPCLDSAFS